MRPVLIIHHRRIFQEGLVASGAHRLLQRHNGLRIVKMILLVCSAAQSVKARRIQRGVCGKTKGIKCVIMSEGHVLRDLLQSDPADLTDHARKIPVHDLAAQSDCLKDSGGLIGLQRGDSHFGRDLDHAVQKRLVVIVDRRVIILVQDPQVNHLGNAFVGQIRIDRPGSEP